MHKTRLPAGCNYIARTYDELILLLEQFGREPEDLDHALTVAHRYFESEPCSQVIVYMEVGGSFSLLGASADSSATETETETETESAPCQQGSIAAPTISGWITYPMLAQSKYTDPRSGRRLPRYLIEISSQEQYARALAWARAAGLHIIQQDRYNAQDSGRLPAAPGPFSGLLAPPSNSGLENTLVELGRYKTQKQRDKAYELLLPPISAEGVAVSRFSAASLSMGDQAQGLSQQHAAVGLVGRENLDQGGDLPSGLPAAESETKPKLRIAETGPFIIFTRSAEQVNKVLLWLEGNFQTGDLWWSTQQPLARKREPTEVPVLMPVGGHSYITAGKDGRLKYGSTSFPPSDLAESFQLGHDVSRVEYALGAIIGRTSPLSDDPGAELKRSFVGAILRRKGRDRHLSNLVAEATLPQPPALPQYPTLKKLLEELQDLLKRADGKAS